MFPAFRGRIHRLKSVIVVVIAVGSLAVVVVVWWSGGGCEIEEEGAGLELRQTRYEVVEKDTLSLPSIDELIRNKLDRLTAKGGPGGGKGGPISDAIVRYRVRSGDSLSSIARRYGVSVCTLVESNGLSDPDFLRVGTEILIPPVDGLLYEVVAGDTIWSIANRYGVDVGGIIRHNGIRDPGMIGVGEKLILPGVRNLRKAAHELSHRGSPGLSWPLRGRITSEFGMRWGRFHSGIDIAAAHGTAIKAAAPGTVSMVGFAGGYGLMVTLSHDNGTATLYAHASRVLVKVDQRVRRGQTIALVGNTGNSTGPHLHFEVIVGGRSVDPLKHLP